MVKYYVVHQEKQRATEIVVPNLVSSAPGLLLSACNDVPEYSYK